MVIWAIAAVGLGETWLTNRLSAPAWIAIYATLVFLYQFLAVAFLSRTSLLPTRGKDLVSGAYVQGACDNPRVGWTRSAGRAGAAVSPVFGCYALVVLLSIIYEIPAIELPSLILWLTMISYLCLAPVSLIHPSRQGLHDIIAKTVPRRCTSVGVDFHECIQHRMQFANMRLKFQFNSEHVWQ